MRTRFNQMTTEDKSLPVFVGPIFFFTLIVAILYFYIYMSYIYIHTQRKIVKDNVLTQCRKDDFFSERVEDL